MIIRVSAVQPCRGRYPAHLNVRVPASPHPPAGHDERPQNIKIKFMRPNGFGFLRPAPGHRGGGESYFVKILSHLTLTLPATPMSVVEPQTL
jgi:hypothetical protein